MTSNKIEMVRVSTRFRVTIPKHVRVKLGLKPSQPLYIRESEGSIILTPVPEDPIAYLRGIFKGGPSLSQELLEDRARELERDEAMFARFFPEASVVIDIGDYERMLDAMEELELIKAYDDAMASPETARPFEEACEDIERRRR